MLFLCAQPEQRPLDTCMDQELPYKGGDTTQSQDVADANTPFGSQTQS
jgi:hypothetical protein